MCTSYARRGRRNFHKRDHLLRSRKEIFLLVKRAVVSFIVRRNSRMQKCIKNISMMR